MFILIMVIILGPDSVPTPVWSVAYWTDANTLGYWLGLLIWSWLFGLLPIFVSRRCFSHPASTYILATLWPVVSFVAIGLGLRLW
jgi:hypothetical protein